MGDKGVLEAAAAVDASARMLGSCTHRFAGRSVTRQIDR